MQTFSFSRRFLPTLALSVCLFSTVIPAQQRIIVDPSFEQPVISANSFLFLNENASAGWNTSHPERANFCSGANCRPLEYWRQVFQGVSAAAGAGEQWAELNADAPSMIYQSICLTNGESFTYSFLHRGRGSATVADVMQHRIGIPSGFPAGLRPPDPYNFNILQVSTTSSGTVTVPPTGSGTINAPVAVGNGWVQYSGTYIYTGTTQLVNIGFSAVSTGSGNLTVGNFVDNWLIQLEPYLELSAAAISNPETTILTGGGATPTNRPTVRVGGRVLAPITVRVAVTGGTATLGGDYSLTIPFQGGNTANFVDITIPPGAYDGTTTGLFPIPFSVSADNGIELDETVTFSPAIIGGGGKIASVVGCGIAPIITTTYTILNDDVVTAAFVPVGGRVTNAFGGGVFAAQVSLTAPTGEVRTAIANPFGYYRFNDVEVGQTYVFSVTAKRFTFAPQAVLINEERTDLNFTAQ